MLVMQYLQQPSAPRFALFFGGVIAAPVMQHHYAGGLLGDHSLHVMGDRDFVRKVSGLPDLALNTARLPPLQSHPPFRCMVCIGGVRPGAAVVRPLYTQKLQLPSLHIIGDRDHVRKVVLACMPCILVHSLESDRAQRMWRVLLQWSEQLAETFENPVIIRHPRGHVVPRLEGDSLATLRAFLEARLQESSL